MTTLTPAKESVLVLGTGVMGSAVAKAFKDGVLDVTVWNRSPKNAYALRDFGIKVSEDLEDAINGSTLVVSCLWNYDTAKPLLHTPQMEAALKGKTFVNYTTCVAQEAREWSKWAAAKGISYLDGAMMTYPKNIGTPTGLLFNSGDHAAFEQHRTALESLGGRAAYVGEDPAAACILDSALLIYHWGTAVALYQSAVVAEAQGLDLPSLTSQLERFSPIIADHASLFAKMAAAEDFNGVQAPLETHLAALEGVHAQAVQCGAPVPLSGAILDIFKQAVEAGRGSEELPVVYDVLRRQISQPQVKV
jgi:3-hydroxyisobutyrate dehydrogenase-like beta-hydroxyacid dehydrogenase